MTLPPELITLASYMAGQFDNQQQALAEPVWYVHLHLWQRPIPLFSDDSLTLFAEQAPITNLDRPYRQRILRLYQSDQSSTGLQVQYYQIKNPDAVRGAGCHPELLQQLTRDDIIGLPDCRLNVQMQQIGLNNYEFTTTSASDRPCRFSYQGNNYQVSLGFEVTADEFRSYDKGIDPSTGKATWGALLGPFRFTKRQDFAGELLI
ncbi:CpcT/CpeT family chromophore lyase [Coleofasciculus sp. E1-EBD-02]|uniref:CpcT/CpeT family chromophore lyase n=1 Tax=Coleofasciculus sp. E1-EBD-02 TaxID=3068481 RepID=UPI0032FF9D1F